MKEIAAAEECGISSISGEQQDAHEALVMLLEAVYVGLSHLAERALDMA